MLLDTNVISELRKVRNPKTDASFAAWAHATDVSVQFISIITVQELETGTLRKERTDPPQGAVLRVWLERQIENVFRGRILPINLAVMRRSAYLIEQRTRNVPDAIIAATAYVYGLPIVTRNLTDFHDAGVDIINPWQV